MIPRAWKMLKEEQEHASALLRKLGNVLIKDEVSKEVPFQEDELIEESEAEETEEKFKNWGLELEELLLKQSQEIEEINSQQSRCLKELKVIQEHNSMLKHELRNGKSSEKELEDKIIQAVDLLIIFRNKRDKLQAELDFAVTELNKNKALSGKDIERTRTPCFFGICFSEIIEATQNFNVSRKIGEGKYGCLYKGIFRGMKVVIRMLPSSGFQSDLEFKHEVEILSRVRHPNLVTLIGACPESKSLIYEYIDNRSLEHCLSSSNKASSLSWKTRMRIATEICSALLFVHGNNNCSIHGNLKPSKILLDSNLVTKISDFGIYSMFSSSLNWETPYMDPEFHSSGDLTPESDIYSFGLILLQLLTARPSTDVVREVKIALETGNIATLLDISAGNWPLEVIEQVTYLGLRCCDENQLDRPNLESEIWTVLEPISKLKNFSQFVVSSSTNHTGNQRNVPSHFLCPIYQEVMKDPHIARDGFTYEGDAINGWFNSGHMTSPMTNLKLEDCGLTPNYALYYAIQEWNHNT